MVIREVTCWCHYLWCEEHLFGISLCSKEYTFSVSFFCHCWYMHVKKETWASTVSLIHVQLLQVEVGSALLMLPCGAVDNTVELFQFLRDFLENVVSQSYTIEWKRSAFFRFVELFPSPTMSQELKSKILQMVLIPCFAQSFERGEGEKLVGSPASPDQDSPDNVVSVFISKVSTSLLS